MGRDVFISYAAADKIVADAVRTRLESVHRVPCAMAPRDASPAASGPDSTIDALDRSKILVFIFRGTADGTLPDACEIERAVRSGINVIPLRLDSAMSPQAVESHVARLAEGVEVLLEKLKAPAGPAGAARKSSWLVPALVGVVLAVAILAVGLRLLGPSAGTSGEAAGPSVDTRDAASPQPTEPRGTPVPAFEPASAQPEPAGSAASPTAGTSAVRSASQPSPDSRTAAAVSAGSLSMPDRTPAAPQAAPSERTAPEGPVGSAALRAGPERAAPKPAETATAVGEAAEAAAGLLATPGTVAIDFINTFPDGSVEVEIDGRKRWSEKLRASKSVGPLSVLKLQRASEQLGSELKLPAGDHKVTVTMLNAEGEVRDIETTSLHVDAARSVTLRIRLTRFRNRLQLESVGG